MSYLLRLELQKFGIVRNVFFMIGAIAFSIAFITVSLVDSMTDPQQTKDTFESTFLVIGLLLSFIFIMYSSVLTARLVIGEYNQGTITIMFSYPLNRKYLIAVKLFIIMVYTAVSITAGYLCCTVYIVLADRYFDMLEGTFQMSLLRIWIPMAVVSIIVCTILTIWPFIAGMMRKSVSAAIITALIVIFFRQMLISKNVSNYESILQIFLIAVITLFASFFIFKKKVSQLY